MKVEVDKKKVKRKWKRKRSTKWKRKLKMRMERDKERKLVAPANPSLRKRQRSSEQPMLATALERACWRL